MGELGDPHYCLAFNEFELSKKLFNELDRPVFEWLYILEAYQGDILDSSLQTLKYVQYDFFAGSAHALFNALPANMSFQPMADMVPDVLKEQVEAELQESQNEVHNDPMRPLQSRLMRSRCLRCSCMAS